MPEEVNRIVTDSIMDYFFITSETANENPRRSGVKDECIFFVGNTMTDTLLAQLPHLQQPAFWDAIGLQERAYLVLTLHRPYNVDDAVKLKVGEELNLMYRDADIYVLPSYQEGFPRTIWEAMANSCPVIATRVGSIPDYLEHGKHARLIEPRSAEAISEAVEHLIENTNVREQLIQNGYTLTMENTLEVQTKKLDDILKNEINAS